MGRPTLPVGLRLAAASLIPIFGLAVPAYLIVDHLALVHQRSISVSDDTLEAKTLASIPDLGRADSSVYAGYQRLLNDDQLVIYGPSGVIYKGPPNQDGRRFTVEAPFPGGRVEIVGDVESTSEYSLELTLIITGALMTAAVAALVGRRLALRSIRDPVERAAAVAELVGHGDLSAKVGEGGPQEFAPLATALDSMTARLEEADLTQRRFLADLAHEIATPISSVALLSDAVMDGTISGEERLAEVADMLHRETHRLRALLNDLAHLRHLDFTESVAFQRVDLGSLLEDLTRRFAAAAKEADVTLTFVSPAPGEDLDTDPRLVETAASNLVSNAIRYTPAGGRVTLHLERIGPNTAVVVRDTGIGIPEDEQTKVFDRFYRVEKSRGRAAGGIGLGLSIAQRAAAAVGGRIELDSEPGKGSEFRLILPPEPPANDEPVPAAHTSQIRPE